MTVREGDRAEGPFALVSVIGGTWVPVGLWYCVYVKIGRYAGLFLVLFVRGSFLRLAACDKRENYIVKKKL